MAKAADSLNPTERTKQIARIFSYFRNPDKETVLTPWRVVNMHLSDCLGGWDFFDESHAGTLEEPRYVNRGEVTDSIFNDPNTHILEINSKTGLYPLYVTYSIYEASCARYRTEHPSALDIPEEVKVQLWDEVVRDNIFVICKTKMAQSITKRTLVGFRQAKTNTHAFDDLINQITNKQTELIEKINKGMLFKNFKNMKFNAIVGNPPYQVMDGGNGASASPIYQYFVNIAKKMNPLFVSMIMPAKWYSGGKGLDDFRNTMLSDNHIRKLYDFTDSRDCFPTADIAGGVCYFLFDGNYSGDCFFSNKLQNAFSSENIPLNEFNIFIRYPKARHIIKKILSVNELMMSDMVSARKPFGLATDVKPMQQGDIKLRYNGGIGFYSSSQIIVGRDMINKWKVMISYLSAEHAGQPDKNGQFRVLSTTEILPPKTICTETYLIAGSFNSEVESRNLYDYLKTKFVRFLVGQAALGQHITRNGFQFVPIQDFSKPWTDEELFKKYNLDEDEIAFIEKMIKPME